MSSAELRSVGDSGSGEGDQASSQSHYSLLKTFVLMAAWLCGDIEV